MSDLLGTMTTEEMESQLGGSLRNLRLQRNLDQVTLAERAGISLKALKNLEGGLGTTVRTLVSVLRALGRTDWLATIAPAASINPVTMLAAGRPRQRAGKPRKPRTAHPASGDDHG